MFQYAPSSVLRQVLPPLDPPDDFYMRSEQVSSASEDLRAPKGLCVRLGDFGTASWFDNHLTEWIQPQMLRAPEIILGAKWDSSAEIWNLGLVIWELAEGKVLFDGCTTPSAVYSAESHLAQMEAVFDSMPKALLARANNAAKYYEDGNLLSKSSFPSCSLDRFTDNPDLIGQEKNDFLDFITAMLKLNPEERPSAEDLLGAEWLQSR